MADALTDEEIDALVKEGTLSPATAASMKAGVQPKPSGPNYGTAAAKMTGAELMEPVPGMTSPWQKAMATAATKAAEDAVAKYHAATRQPTAAPALAPGQIAPNTIAPGATFGPPKETRGAGAAPEAVSPDLDATMGKALPKSSAVAGGAATPKVAANLIDPALLDALHSSGELSPETAAKLHEMNGTESKIEAKAEMKAAKEDEKLAAAEKAK